MTQEPIAVLPKEFAPLEKLLQDMPWVKKDGTPGLLQQYKFGEASKAIPDYSDLIRPIEDTNLLNSLFRDYTFWASSYLLEPCHHNMLAAGDTSTFGLGRQVLPVNISAPLIMIANKIGSKPFMEYAQSYA
jgi:indoleamine 2,3-dioxygenase